VSSVEIATLLLPPSSTTNFLPVASTIKFPEYEVIISFDLIIKNRIINELTLHEK
jgi:hypothetical protein